MPLVAQSQCHPSISRVLILCAVSEHAHACCEGAAGELGVEAFREYAFLLQQEVANARTQGGQTLHPTVRVEVRELPLLMCSLDAGAFVLPASSAAMLQSR
jgi:hypothetical protein